MVEYKTLFIMFFLFISLVGGVFALSISPIIVPIEKGKNVSVVEIVDLDSGIKTNMTSTSKTALINELAIDYAVYTKTAVNVSKVDVLGQSVKGCITFTYVKFDGKLFTEVSAKRGCVVSKPIVKDVDTIVVDLVK